MNALSTTTLPPGTPVAAYLRDSGGDTQELSLPQQEAEIRAWCEARGLALTRIFRDEARPGSSTVGREGFLAMIRHFRSGQAPERALVIWKYSRFARDTDDAQFYRADLRRRGIQIISLHDQIPEGPAGRFFEAALDWMNQQFLLDLSTDVKRGLRHLVSQYGCVPGTPPRGFRRVPVTIGKRRDGRPHICHRWEPDPETAPLIRQAFEMRAAGVPITHIHEQLHLYRGRNSYTAFFRNKLYIGVLEYSGETYENYCDPIVDPQTFAAVQRIMEDTAERFGKRHPRRAHSPFLLSGLAYCARCGAPLYGHVAVRNGKRRNEAYRCTRAKRHAGCNAPYIPRYALETAIIQSLTEHILTPTNLSALHHGYLQYLEKHRAERAEKIAALQKQKSGLSRRITNITSAIAQAGPMPALLDELKTLEGQRAALESQINALNAEPEPLPPLTEEDIAAFARRLVELLDTSTPDEQRAILRGIIARITVDRNQTQIFGEIEYYYPPPLLINQEAGENTGFTWSSMQLCPQWDLNPCRGLERPVS